MMKKFNVIISVLFMLGAFGVRAESSWYLHWTVDFTARDNNPIRAGESLDVWLEINGVKDVQRIPNLTSGTTSLGGAYASTSLGSYATQPTLTSVRALIGDYESGTAHYVSQYFASSDYNSYVVNTSSPATAAWNVGAATWSVVPEPTGGLLTLLGVAALALRRRKPRLA